MNMRRDDMSDDFSGDLPSEIFESESWSNDRFASLVRDSNSADLPAEILGLEQEVEVALESTATESPIGPSPLSAKKSAKKRSGQIPVGWRRVLAVSGTVVAATVCGVLLTTLPRWDSSAVVNEIGEPLPTTGYGNQDLNGDNSPANLANGVVLEKSGEMEVSEISPEFPDEAERPQLNDALPAVNQAPGQNNPVPTQTGGEATVTVPDGGTVTLGGVKNKYWDRGKGMQSGDLLGRHDLAGAPRELLSGQLFQYLGQAGQAGGQQQPHSRPDLTVGVNGVFGTVEQIGGINVNQAGDLGLMGGEIYSTFSGKASSLHTQLNQLQGAYRSALTQNETVSVLKEGKSLPHYKAKATELALVVGQLQMLRDEDLAAIDMDGRLDALGKQKAELEKELGTRHPELQSVVQQLSWLEGLRDSGSLKNGSTLSDVLDQAKEELQFFRKAAQSIEAREKLLAELQGKIKQVKEQIAAQRQARLVAFYYNDYRDRKDKDPDFNEQYEMLPENQFLKPNGESALSTFSIEVDTASYANARRFITGLRLPPIQSVRVEEFVNYFRYDYPEPADRKPFSVTTTVAECPWDATHKLLRIGLKGKEIPVDDRPPSNLVFLIDVSGSMSDQNKLPLLQRSMLMLVDRLTENDRVTIVTYAGNAGVRLQPTSGDQKQKIRDVINGLGAGGSTHGSAGIHMAYDLAEKHFIDAGTNRVILATDGDLNVGVTADDELVKLITDQAKKGVFLSVLGFGTGNLKDAKLEKLADNGNGQYSYVDSIAEARKVLVEEMVGSLITIAKDVKIQLEFNPGKVASYRLIGYENRALKNEDFDNDAVDAGEIGAGHTVTALYEIVPVGAEKASVQTEEVEKPKLKYQRRLPEQEQQDQNQANQNQAAEDVILAKRVQAAENLKYELTQAANSDDLLTVSLRYKEPEANESELIEVSVADSQCKFQDAPQDFRFAASVASFGMLLRHSRYAGSWRLDQIEQAAVAALGDDKQGHRAGFVDLVRQTRNLVEGPR